MVKYHCKLVKVGTKPHKRHARHRKHVGHKARRHTSTLSGPYITSVRKKAIEDCKAKAVHSKGFKSCVRKETRHISSRKHAFRDSSDIDRVFDSFLE